MEESGDHLKFQHFRVPLVDGKPAELGRGAMGVTYRAFDVNLNVPVALKVITPTLLADGTTRERFLREARSAAALRHPNVAGVLFLGEQEGQIFYAMEYVEGETVAEFVRREKAVPPTVALEIVEQVSQALMGAERAGMVHRDLKPANIMLARSAEGELVVKVIDFGLAKTMGNSDATMSLTQGGFLGTPLFASPEQLEEREVDIRSDIYSLGVTLFTMLIGHAPFVGSTAQVMSQHLHREPPWEQISDQPVAVLELLRAMLAKDPGARPGSASELRDRVRACRERLGARAAAGPPLPVAVGDSSEAVDDQSEVTLLDVVRRRGRLDWAAGLAVLTAVAEHLAGADGERAVAERGGLTLNEVRLPDLRDAGDELREPVVVEFAAIAGTGAEMTIQGTMVGGTADVAQGWQGRVLARIAYEAFGGTRFEDGAWVPLAELTESANRQLRSVLVRPGRVVGPREFVAELAASGGRAIGGGGGELPVSGARPGAGLRGSVPIDNADVPEARRSVAGRRGWWLTGALLALVLVGVGVVGWVLVAGGGDSGSAAKPAVTAEDAEDTTEVVTAPAVVEAQPEEPPEESAADRAKREAAEAFQAQFAAARALELAGQDAAALEAYAALEGSGAWAAMEAIAAKMESEHSDGIPDAQFVAMRAALEAAAKRHVTSAQYLLGANLRPRDPREALIWLVKAGRNGRTEAMVLAGLMFSNGDGLAARDYGQAAAWFQQAADRGDMNGFYYLAECYLDGVGVAASPDRAAELFGTAADLGDDRALYMLGRLSEDGRGVPRDATEAVQYYESAARQGNADAQARLGVLLMNGEGVKANPRRAVNLWKAGAESGHAASMYLYSISLRDPRFGADLASARRWLEKAAAAGSPEAREALGREGR